MKHFTFWFVITVCTGLIWSVHSRADSLPELTDLSVFVDDSGTATTVLTWTNPTTYADGATLPAGKLVATLIKCMTDATSDYATANTDTHDQYVAWWNTTRVTPGTWNAELNAVAVIAPATTVSVAGFVPPLGGHYECRASTIARAALSDSIFVASAWSDKTVLGKFLRPASPAAPTGLNTQ